MHSSLAKVIKGHVAKVTRLYSLEESLQKLTQTDDKNSLPSKMSKVTDNVITENRQTDKK